MLSHGIDYCRKSVIFRVTNLRKRINRKLLRTSSQYWPFYQLGRSKVTNYYRSRRVYKKYIIMVWNNRYYLIDFFYTSNKQFFFVTTQGSTTFKLLNLNFWLLTFYKNTFIIVNFIFLYNATSKLLNTISFVWRFLWKFKHFRTFKQPLIIIERSNTVNPVFVQLEYRSLRFRLLSFSDLNNLNRIDRVSFNKKLADFYYKIPYIKLPKLSLKYSAKLYLKCINIFLFNYNSLNSILNIYNLCKFIIINDIL